MLICDNQFGIYLPILDIYICCYCCFIDMQIYLVLNKRCTDLQLGCLRRQNPAMFERRQTGRNVYIYIDRQIDQIRLDQIRLDQMSSEQSRLAQSIQIRLDWIGLDGIGLSKIKIRLGQIMQMDFDRQHNIQSVHIFFVLSHLSIYPSINLIACNRMESSLI